MPRIIKEYNRLPKEVRGKVKKLNNLSGKEWVQLSKSINVYGGPIAEKRREHGAAFPLELAKHFINIYTSEGDTVLDPFLGVGTVSDACTLLNRLCIGFEINENYLGLARQGLDPVDCNSHPVHDVEHKLYQESCLHLLDYTEPSSIDLTITSPPYSNLLHKVAAHFAGYTYQKNIYKNQGRILTRPYSDHEEDFGNLDWEGYLNNVSKLMGLLYQVAKEGSFNVWVVRDFRDIEDHIPYVNLHSKIIDCATSQGWILVDIVIWDQTGQRKLVKLGGPKARRFYFNIGHSFIIVLRKNQYGEKFRTI
jgi:DNA modification methylase